MSRDAEKQAKSTYAAQNAAAQKYGQQADTLYGQLLPQYTQMATNPSGFDRTTLNNMTTAGMQANGGATAGAVGQGNLMAARTGNIGGYQYANDAAARAGMEKNSEAALDTQLKNADYKRAQTAQGLAGLNGLYATNLGTSMNELNAENASTKTLSDAGQSGWFQNFLGYMNAMSNAAKAGAGAA